MQDPNLQVEEPAIQLQAPAEQAIGQDSDLDPNDPNLDALSLASSFAIGENVTHKRSKPEINFEPHIDKCVHFQIQVSIIEAKQLSGTNMDPVCMLQIGDDKKYSTQKVQTNSPYWNEVFVFDYNLPREQMFDQIMQFSVYANKSLVRTGALVGMFKLDVGTIYSQPDHQFNKKWAVLTDPNDLNTGPKGYLKVDIMVVGKGDIVRSLTSKKVDENEDDIELNMLAPVGMQPAGERQRARFLFKIYQADGLVKMSTDITSKIKSTLLGENKDLCDPFVEVTFCGQKGQTAVKKSSYAPNFSEQIIFTELFPPMCCRAKIQIKDKSMLNDTGVRSSAIGTHYIDLTKICHPGDKGFLPTFGPTYINFYGGPRSYSMMNEFSDLNEGLGEGVAYRGRLMVAIEVQLTDAVGSDSGSTEPEVEQIPQLSEFGAGQNDEFFLFGTILEASMIDKKLADKQISFELTMGNYGNQIDGHNVSSRGGGGGDEDEDDDDDRAQLISRKGSVSQSAVSSIDDTLKNSLHSTTPSAKPRTSDKQYYTRML